jgi:hypothetical protein
MGRRERIALWAAVGLLAGWLLVATLQVSGELAAIDDLMGQREGGDPAAARQPTPWWGGSAEDEGQAPAGDGEAVPWAGSAAGPQIGVAGVQALSGTLAMTVTVRSSGVGDLLVEPPLVVSQDGWTYRVGGESLEAARMAFLDLVTRGQATARLEFAADPPPGARLVLVFNPGQAPDDLLAPRVEVMLPLLPGRPAATPTPGG